MNGKPGRGQGLGNLISLLTMADPPVGVGWMALGFHVRERFLSYVCGLNLGDGWGTPLIFPVEMYRKVSVSTRDRCQRKPLKSW